MNYVNWKRNPFSKLNNGGFFSLDTFLFFFFQNTQSWHYYTTSTNVNIIRNSCQVNKYLQ